MAKFIISLSLIDPAGWITALTPDWTNFSNPSTNGKKASDALTKSVSEAGKIVNVPTPTIDKIYKEVKNKAEKAGCYINPNL